ncbi:MAG TPA: hypothetical protein VLJ58_13690, partial [Ramlibacter sp.]|nr:hypothetical protein [Ramlibacter sp.]
MAAASNEALCWLAAAVAGRPVPVATADSGPSWSDGRTIYLAAALSVSQRRCAVVAHALLIAAGSLSPALRWLTVHPTRLRRYLGLELLRAHRLHQDRVPAGFAAQAGLPFGPSLSDGVESSLRLVHDARVVVAEPPIWLGTLRPLRLKAPEETHQNARAGTKTPDADEGRSRGLDEHDHEALEKLRSPLTRGFGIAEVLLRLLGYRRGLGAQSGQAEGPAALAQASGDQTGQGGNALSMGGRLRLLPRTFANERDEAGVHRYPEWNRRHQRYQADHVTLTEIVPLVDSGASLQPAVAALDVPGLRAALARVAVTFERVHRQPSGEDLDLDALIDMRVQ